MVNAKAIEQRESLSAERIELAALELIEEQGLSAFSLRKLAKKLGCEAMSIYHYFPSKGHLMDALVDRVISEMLPVPDKGLPWIERVRIAMMDWRRVFTSRPSLYIFMATHRLNTPAALRMLDGIIGLFCDGGLEREEAVRVFRALGYYLMGAGLDETAGYTHGPSTVEPVPGDIMQREYPNVVAAAPYFRAIEWDKTFELGLDLLLRSVEELVEERRQEASRRVQAGG